MVMPDLIHNILIWIGEAMIGLGILSDVIAAIGMLRFPNFFVRLHAATVGTIWGAFLPLIGAAILSAGAEYLGSYRWFMSGGALVTAVLILMLAPAGSHALARAAYRSKAARVEPKCVDHLEKHFKGEEK